jgi:hypothetical protein
MKVSFLLGNFALLKVIRTFSDGFTAGILHATLKSLTFMGEYEPSQVKSTEDELIYKIMSKYEAEKSLEVVQSIKRSLNAHLHLPNEIAQSVVNDLIEETVNGVEIAIFTENILNTMKVSRTIYVVLDFLTFWYLNRAIHPYILPLFAKICYVRFRRYYNQQ